METRSVNITFETAKEWYEKGNPLKEIALQAFTEKELKRDYFKSITTMDNVIALLGIDRGTYTYLSANLRLYSKASAAAFNLNLVRKALNLFYRINFTEGRVWYPSNPLISSDSCCCKGQNEVEVAKVKIENNVYTLLGGDADISVRSGLGGFSAGYNICVSNQGFLGCATQEIAKHMSKYFAKLIFEAKYGDIVDYEWIKKS